MKILFVQSGKGTAGSWLVRGLQIAERLGAKAIANPEEWNLREADIIILVKKADDVLAARLRKVGRPVIWDLLDCWLQPEDNTWDRDIAIKRFTSRFNHPGVNASAVIFATRQMQKDLGKVVKVPSKVIYHHPRPGQIPNPIRDRIEMIGYEGSSRYLEGGWFSAIGNACERMGAAFIANPSRLAALDVVIAARGERWRGYQTDNWKSNVKLANAQASGTPFIGLPEKGCTETASGAEIWVDGPGDVREAIRCLEDRDARGRAKNQLLAAAPNADDILTEYRALCSQFAS